MATIALYQGKINQMPGLIKAAKQSVESLKTELSSLQKKASKVDSGVCDMSEVISSVETCTKTQENRIEALDSFQTKLDEYVNDAVRIDNKVAETVNKNKKDFYEKYDYLKPDCEKSFLEHLKDAAEWCKEHWREILVVLEIVVAVVCLCVPGLQGVGAFILQNMLKGLLTGLIMGAVVGGMAGYAKYGVKGILPGLLEGGINGALTGAAFGGLGGFGGIAGELFGCSEFMVGLFAVSSTLSLSMLAFDSLALLYDFQTRFEKDTGIKLHLIDSDAGHVISELNKKAHANSWYNAFQFAAGGVSAFSGGYVQNAACFIAGTLVATAIGLKPIEEIRAGDIILSCDMHTMQSGYKQVVETYIRKVERIICLTISGETIVTTVDHPFYVKDLGFLCAADLCIGSQLLDNMGHIHRVEQIIRKNLQNERIDVFNLQVDELHTYYVGRLGILVHNATYPKSELETLENTENFKEGAIEHIFDGEINAKGKAVGYHYEGIENSSGSVIEGTRSTPGANGVYSGQVSVNGVPKTANGGMSTFFPENMTPQEVVNCINEAYGNKTLVPGTYNTYQGTSSSGIEVNMYIDADGSIISAFPVGGE